MQRKSQSDEVAKRMGAALAFLAVARTSRWGPLWTLALAYGLRHHELRGLRWDDLKERTGELTVRNLKTHRDRTLTLVRPILDQLVAWRKDPANAAHTSASWMFVARPGRQMAKPTLSAEFAGLAEGLPPLTVHGLRHTAATLMIRRGVPIARVSEILGHHSPAFTYQQYGWSVPSDDRLVEQAVSGLLEGVSGAVSGDEQRNGSGHIE